MAKVCAMAGLSAQVDVLSTVEGIQSEYDKLIVREVCISAHCKLSYEADFIATERAEVMFVVCFKPIDGERVVRIRSILFLCVIISTLYFKEKY
jgi:hypothetical protein